MITKFTNYLCFFVKRSFQFRYCFASISVIFIIFHSYKDISVSCQETCTIGTTSKQAITPPSIRCINERSTSLIVRTSMFIFWFGTSVQRLRFFSMFCSFFIKAAVNYKGIASWVTSASNCSDILCCVALHWEASASFWIRSFWTGIVTHSHCVKVIIIIIIIIITVYWTIYPQWLFTCPLI